MPFIRDGLIDIHFHNTYLRIELSGFVIKFTCVLMFLISTIRIFCGARINAFTYIAGIVSGILTIFILSQVHGFFSMLNSPENGIVSNEYYDLSVATLALQAMSAIAIAMLGYRFGKSKFADG